VALLAGLAIFPLALGLGFSPNAGDTLVFVTMTEVFAQLGAAGQFIGPLFFLLASSSSF
jgi:SNF family Na+-dependent transporter